MNWRQRTLHCAPVPGEWLASVWGA